MMFPLKWYIYDMVISFPPHILRKQRYRIGIVCNPMLLQFLVKSTIIIFSVYVCCICSVVLVRCMKELWNSEFNLKIKLPTERKTEIEEGRRNQEEKQKPRNKKRHQKQILLCFAELTLKMDG